MTSHLLSLPLRRPTLSARPPTRAGLTGCQSVSVGPVVAPHYPLFARWIMMPCLSLHLVCDPYLFAPSTTHATVPAHSAVGAELGTAFECAVPALQHTGTAARSAV
jgi:hypothetical protein